MADKSWDYEDQKYRLLAMSLMNQGKINQDVLAGLVDQGMNQSDAEKLVHEIRAGNQSKEKKEAIRYITFGSVLVVIAIVGGLILLPSASRASEEMVELGAAICFSAGSAMVGRGVYLIW